jgi:hypothetical protein
VDDNRPTFLPDVLSKEHEPTITFFTLAWEGTFASPKSQQVRSQKIPCGPSHVDPKSQLASQDHGVGTIEGPGTG